MLDTFVIARVYERIDSNENLTKNIKNNNVVSTETSYSDDNIEINIVTYREYDTNIYVADIYCDGNYLKTYLAHNSYGKNVTEKTSNMAETVNALLAINGDYYGAREKGYVIRNGRIYRDIASNNQEDLVIYYDGSMEIINENNISASELINNGVYNLLSFGPGLISDGEIIIDENDEVGRSMASNPRTAIGMIDDNHYIFVVSDGRTSENDGLSLYELALFMKKLGCKVSYNLDGGGSSTMYFNGNIINNPTGGIRSSNERSVSDIVYIGY